MTKFKGKKKVTFLINWIYRYNLIYFQSYAQNVIAHISQKLTIKFKK